MSVSVSACVDNKVKRAEEKIKAERTPSNKENETERKRERMKEDKEEEKEEKEENRHLFVC